MVKTQVIEITRDTDRAGAIQRAAEVLDQSGLVAFPTETVYGVAARVDRPEAVNRLRSVKSRLEEKAFTVHVESRERVAGLAPDVAGVGARLMRRGWPGPLTLIVDVKDPLETPIMARLKPDAASAMFYNNTIGFRCPDDAVAGALLRAVDAPVIASSANLAGQAPPTEGQDVLKALEGRVDLLLDSGQTKYAKPSTIVKVSGDGYHVVREGVYDAGMVQRMSPLRVLFVCTGNTCRSPMAEGVAKKVLAERIGCAVEELPGRGILVGSAGTSGGFGLASEFGVAAMANRGIDISKHVSSQLTAEMVREADHVFVMTAPHLRRVCELEPSATDRVMLLMDSGDVMDPIGGDAREYEFCAQTIEQGVRNRLEEVTP